MVGQCEGTLVYITVSILRSLLLVVSTLRSLLLVVRRQLYSLLLTINTIIFLSLHRRVSLKRNVKDLVFL